MQHISLQNRMLMSTVSKKTNYCEKAMATVGTVRLNIMSIFCFTLLSILLAKYAAMSLRILQLIPQARKSQSNQLCYSMCSRRCIQRSICIRCDKEHTFNFAFNKHQLASHCLMMMMMMMEEMMMMKETLEV